MRRGNGIFHHTFWILLIFFLLLIFSGCSSIQSIIRSSIEDTPIWVFEPRVSKERIPFVGTGTGTDVRSARVHAYESVLSQLSDYLGKDVMNTYIAQLSQRNAIDAYNLNITREYVKEGIESVTVHLLAVADRSAVEADRSELLVEIEKTKAKISALQASAGTALRENRDGDAVSDYFSIIALASTIVGSQGDDYYDSAVGNIISIAEKITIVPVEGLSDAFYVQRGSKAIAPKVEGIPLIFSIKVKDAMNNGYTDTITSTSDGDGIVRFINTNSSMLYKGTYQVSLDAGRLLSEVAFLREADRTRIEDLISSSTISVPYTRTYTLGTNRLLVALGEYSIRGSLLESRTAEAILTEYLSGYGFAFSSVHDSIREDDEDFFAELTRGGAGSSDIVLYGKVGVVAFTTLSDSLSVKVAGEMSIYRVSDQQLLGTTGMVNAVGRGKDQESALSDAFAMYGREIAALLKRFLLT